MVYFVNMKAISAVPYPQCQNENSTFLILSEHFAAKSLFPATQKEPFPKSLYNHSPLAPSQTHFMTLGFHILLLCGSHQSRISVYAHVLYSSEQTTAENKFNIEQTSWISLKK